MITAPHRAFVIGSVALAAVLAACPAWADKVVLSAKNGGFDVEGVLKEFDGSTYTLETSGGEMKLAANAYACTGTGCPNQPAAAVKVETPSPAPATAGGRIVVKGSNTIGAELFPSIVRAFASARGTTAEETLGATITEASFAVGKDGAADQITVALARSGSKSGIAALIKSETDLALADRGIHAEEMAQLPVQSGASRVTTNVLGLDGIVVVVGSGVRTKSLTSEQLARVFAGEIKDWSDLGLKPGTINVYAPADGHGTLDLFMRHALTPFKVAMSPTATRRDTNVSLAEAVQRDPNGIGILSMSFAGNLQTLDIVSACGLVSQPSPFALKSEEYALSRRLNIFSRPGSLSPQASALITFALSDRGQKIVASHQFTDQAIISVPFAHEAHRVRMGTPQTKLDAAAKGRLLGDLQDKRRLSVTFRFASGTSVLEARSRQELDRLAQHLRQPEMSGKAVLLAGFSDSLGTPGPNQILSQKRAEQVRASLIGVMGADAKLDLVTARGYGSLAPVACNDSAEGQNVNRRVEVWMQGG